ncbi:hypothetical protein ES703_04170 [subsurface metagenome]|nr:hypothetical protein [bacterium]
MGDVRTLLTQLTARELNTCRLGQCVKVHEKEWSVDLEYEEPFGEEFEVPLRVKDIGNDYGIVVVPKLKTWCAVDFVNADVRRPIVIACQEWSKILVKREAKPKIEVILERTKIEAKIGEMFVRINTIPPSVVIGASGGALEHPMIKGDILLPVLVALGAAIDVFATGVSAHIHFPLVIPPTVPVPACTPRIAYPSGRRECNHIESGGGAE